jgi:hypothetical protein
LCLTLAIATAADKVTPNAHISEPPPAETLADEPLPGNVQPVYEGGISEPPPAEVPDEEPLPEDTQHAYDNRINEETFVLLSVGMDMDEVSETIGGPHTSEFIMELSDGVSISRTWMGEDSVSITATFRDGHATRFEIYRDTLPENSANGPGGINMATFAQLRLGMSVDEVLEIITVPYTSAQMWEALGEPAFDMFWYLDDHSGSMSVLTTDGYVTYLLQYGLEY